MGLSHTMLINFIFSTDTIDNYKVVVLVITKRTTGSRSMSVVMIKLINTVDDPSCCCFDGTYAVSVWQNKFGWFCY